MQRGSSQGFLGYDELEEPEKHLCRHIQWVVREMRATERQKKLEKHGIQWSKAPLPNMVATKPRWQSETWLIRMKCASCYI